MTIDANFVDIEGAMNHSFVLPIDAVEADIALVIKTWLEEKEASDAEPFDTLTEIDISAVVTKRLDIKEYEKDKRELAELNVLVSLGAMDANDKEITDKQAKTKAQHDKVK